MALKLDLTGGAVGQATRTLAAGTLSIGRGERNDWVLPDPERHLSKTHCMISLENGRFVLTDLSTNGVYINGARQPTTRDSTIVLTDGDQFRIGEYTIHVQEIEGAGAMPLAQGDDPLAIDPLDDPLGRPSDPSFSHPMRAAPAMHRAEDPFDRVDESRRRPGGLDNDDLFSGVRPATSWQGPSQPDNADAVRHAMPMPNVLHPANPGDIDFDALIGDLSPEPPRSPAASPPPAPPRAQPPQADPFAEIDDLLAPPPQPAAPPPAPQHAAPPPASPQPVQAPAAPPAPPPHAQAQTQAQTQDEAVRAALAAFLDGAGIPNAPLGGDPTEAMHQVGLIFRALTEGVRDVLMSRASIKSELRVEQTLLKAANNNALKFSFSPEEAVLALLSTNRPGYMPPLEAAREAFDDIKLHELAVMAGVQTALVGLLRRFDPAALEGRLTQGRLASMMPAARKARLWDNFCEMYKTIASEAEDDFQAVFGRAFAKAYEAQSQKRG